MGSIDSKNITKKIIIILNEIMESKKIENFNIKIHVVIGSLSKNISVTARYIINNSPIPVINIRPKERKHITGPTTAF